MVRTENIEEELLEIDFDRLAAETPLAWCIEIDGRGFWIPKSKCDIEIEERIAHVPEWLAVEKELI